MSKSAPPPITKLDERVRELNRLCHDFQTSNPGLDVNVAMQAAIAAFRKGNNQVLKEAEERGTPKEAFYRFLSTRPPREKHFAEIFLYDEDGNLLRENPSFFEGGADTRQYKEVCISVVRDMVLSASNLGHITMETYRRATDLLRSFL
jgi:hypothetical protein